MSVGELLRSQRRWGRTRARKFLGMMAMNENRQLGRLTERQRIALAAELERKRASRSPLAQLHPNPGAAPEGLSEGPGAAAEHRDPDRDPGADRRRSRVRR